MRLHGWMILLLWCGCGPRSLDAHLALDHATCTGGAVPAGGSLYWQVSTDGVPLAECSACLTLAAGLADGDAVIAFLRVNAPGCERLTPRSTLDIHAAGWKDGKCPMKGAKAATLFCAHAALQVPDGRSDSSQTLTFSCDGSCALGCVPISCAAEGKNCGMLPDGCGNMLDCGKCAGGKPCVANVCSP
jgi:hypothetical protein